MEKKHEPTSDIEPVLVDVPETWPLDLNMIYRGSTRTVVTFGPLAFKFGRGKNGMRCNRHEADLYRRSVKPAFRFPCLDLLGAGRSIGDTMPERRPGGIACRVGSRSESTAGRVREGAASHLHTPRLDNHRSVTKPQVPNNLARSTRATCIWIGLHVAQCHNGGLPS